MHAMFSSQWRSNCPPRFVHLPKRPIKMRDPDGDALTFEWYRDGTKIDEGAVLEAELAANGSTLTLVVTDETGRTSWSNGLSADGA